MLRLRLGLSDLDKIAANASVSAAVSPDKNVAVGRAVGTMYALMACVAVVLAGALL
jgi:hypothetical protein